MKKIVAAFALILAPSVVFAEQGDMVIGTTETPASHSTNYNTIQSNFDELYGKLVQGLLTSDTPRFAGVNLGTASTTTGLLNFYGNTKAFSFGLFSQGADSPGIGWRFPSAMPAGTYLISADTNGYLDYVNPTSLTAITATGFDGNLNTGIDTLQELAQSVDDLSITGGYTNLTSFVTQTANSVFYSDANGDVKEVTLGSNGTYFRSNGPGSAPTFDTPSGAAHDAVTLDTELATILSLSTQQITLDSQTANYIFAAPNGSAGDPTFRAMVDADIPSAIARDTELPTDATISTSAVSTNDASTTKHGWLMMATAPAAGFRNVVAIDNAETSYKNAALFDATVPSTQASGDAAAAGTAMTAARRDHKHAMPTITDDQTAAEVNITDAGGYFTGTNVETVTQELGAKLPTGTDGTRRLILADNPSGIAPTAAAWEVYVDNGVWKMNTNGTEATIVYAGGSVGAATATTPSANDNDTSVATTAFVAGEVRKKYVSGSEADFYGTLLDPQAIYAVDGTNHAVTIANNVPAAFTITEINVSCDADPTTEITLTFQHKTAGVGYGTPTTIEAVATTNGAATITTGFDDATIPAGTKLFMTLSDPDDALNECAWQIEGDWD